MVMLVEKQSIGSVVESHHLFRDELVGRVEQPIELFHSRLLLRVLRALDQLREVLRLRFYLGADAKNLVEQLDLPAQKHRSLFEIENASL